MSDQQFRRDLICAALARQPYNPNTSVEATAALVVRIADAALAAAGEQDGAMSWRDVAADFDAKLSAAQAEIVSLKAENSRFSDQLVARNVELVDCNNDLFAARAEISRLKRLQEPLTEEEKCLVAKDAHGHLVVRDLVALDLTNPNFSVRLFVAMLERSITAVKNRRA